MDLRSAAHRARPGGAADVVIAPNDIAIVQAVKHCRALERHATIILIVGADVLDEEIVVGRFRLRPMRNVLHVGDRSGLLVKIEADILAALMTPAKR